MSPVAPADAQEPVTTEEWHGWGWTDNRRPDLHIGPWEGRYVLFTEHVNEAGSTVGQILATFNTERDARTAMEAIDYLAGFRR